MNARERVLASLHHQEPDRIPSFELAFGTRLASRVLGRKCFFPRSGGSSLARILLANADGRASRRAAIREGTLTQVELFVALGYDAMCLIPTEFIQAVSESFGLFGSNFLLDVSIQEIGHNTWKVSDPEGFWSVHRFDEEHDVFYAVRDSVSEGGLPALKRYVDALAARGTILNEHTNDALESIRLAVQSDAVRSGNLFLLGHCDVCMPTADAFLAVFAEAMALEPELVERFFQVTTDGLLPILEAQLALGVDGIMGANDWCYKTGPMMSPQMFRRFLAPHLKRIVDVTHHHGKPFIKHLDGNTELLLPTLVETIGIDAYHSVEPSAGMDIRGLKNRYKGRLSVWGNVDCGDLLVNGTPGQVSETSRSLIHDLAPGGGYVFSSSNAIHDAIPFENLRAMLDARDMFGAYPIA
jgi:hypothetical protein